MRKRFRNIHVRLACLTVIFMIFFLAGCATSPEMHGIPVAKARSGNYSEAVSYLDSHEKELYGPKDKVVKELDRGLLCNYAGDYQTSTVNLKEAEELIYYYYSKSITQEISSFIVNDTAIDYPGEDYEDIYTNLFMSLNYYYQGNLDDAIVEMNRFVNKVQTFSSRHEAELFKARKAANLQNGSPVSVEFHNSALGQYLSMLYHRAAHDMDAASADRHMISDAFITQKKLYPFSEPDSLDNELSVPLSKGRLNVLAFSGLSPLKVEKRTEFGSYVFAVPEMMKQHSPVRYIKVIAAEKKSGRTFECGLSQIESIENISLDTFLLRSEIIYSKALARCLLKGTTTVAGRAIGDRMANSSDSSVAVVGNLIQLLSMANDASTHLTENADLRISRYFPARADVGGITLDPGIYDVTVLFYTAEDGTVVASRHYNGIDVQPEKLALIESVCLESVPAHRD